MFQFALANALFRLKYENPAFTPLFELPPTSTQPKALLYFSYSKIIFYRYYKDLEYKNMNIQFFTRKLCRGKMWNCENFQKDSIEILKIFVCF